MMTRTATTTTTLGRQASDRRRIRRRVGLTRSLYCSTNGCTSFLELDPTTGIATCRICGLSRATH